MAEPEHCIFWTCLKALFYGLIACAVIVSCLPMPQEPADTNPSTGKIASTPEDLNTPADKFSATAWMSDPNPPRDSRVILFGRLNKNGVFLNGIMMRAYWQDAETVKDTPNCYVMVNYQRGVCTINVSKFPAGTYVPIRIEIEYKGIRYAAQTGFTPR